MSGVIREANSLIEDILGDVKKGSAAKQIVLGTFSGWVTGFLAMRVGKSAALAMGGGILLLQIANEKGYLKINWDKVDRGLNKVADKVEEKITGEGPSWLDKTEDFLDAKVNKIQRQVKKNQSRAMKLLFGSNSDNWQMKEIHIFVLSFAVGVAIGVGIS